ncbi:H-NS histone family protein [Burkholderia gladioli]|uniref:H-NS histone family protein n=1 Tax=Burkholderia gladioli TaxID=28095 RepID=UPI001C5E28FE|nr:H-NS histone family protein [Burkholderia gladioli]MBW5284179.1 H-NS histone family protein [Burkholderia gladioli]
MATSFKRTEKELSALRAGYISEAAAKIRDLMEQHGVTINDLQFKQPRSRGTRAGSTLKKAQGTPAAKRTSPLKGRKLELSPKYRNPKTGQTWTGHGRPPGWISVAKNRSKFLIQK